MKDKKTISNQPGEINQAAKQLGVEPIAIHLVKHILNTNDRETLYEYIKSHKGQSLGVIL